MNLSTARSLRVFRNFREALIAIHIRLSLHPLLLHTLCKLIKGANTPDLKVVPTFKCWHQLQFTSRHNVRQADRWTDLKCAYLVIFSIWVSQRTRTGKNPHSRYLSESDPFRPNKSCICIRKSSSYGILPMNNKQSKLTTWDGVPFKFCDKKILEMQRKNVAAFGLFLAVK